MFYTDFKKTAITDNRQTAIINSRNLAKQQFVQSIAKVEMSTDDYYGHEQYDLVSNAKHEEIVAAYESYLINRSTVYEVKFIKIDKSF